MAESIVYLRDRHGPFAGLERPYTKTAAENAVATGYAEPIESESTETEPEAGAGESAPPEDLSRLSVDELQVRLEAADIDVESIEGTGKGGNVVKADLIRALESPAEPGSEADQGDAETSEGGPEGEEEDAGTPWGDASDAESDLPEDFPWREKIVAAEIVTLEQLRAHLEAGTIGETVDGLGPARVEQIEKFVAEADAAKSETED